MIKIPEMEIWKEIKWYEWLYQISNTGLVKRSYQSGKVRILKDSLNTQGYFKTVLSKYNILKTYRTHRLVMQTFIGKSDLEVNHINWIKTDNRLENLEYCTHKENMIHSYSLWLHKGHTRMGKKVVQMDKAGCVIKYWESGTEVYRHLWIYSQNISKVCYWNRKTAWWFTWKYI